MHIEAGKTVIQCSSVQTETINGGGVPIQTAKIIFPGAVSQEQIDALLQNPWTVYDDAGKLVGVRSGYTRVKDCCLTLLRMSDDFALRLKAATDELAAKKAAADLVASEAEEYVYQCQRTDAALTEAKIAALKAVR